jgi:hypothetical protein
MQESNLLNKKATNRMLNPVCFIQLQQKVHYQKPQIQEFGLFIQHSCFRNSIPSECT